MSAGKTDLYIEQGSTFKRKLVFKDGSNVAIDLTGDVFAGQIRKSISDPTIVASFTCVLTNPTLGEVEISLTAAETSAITLKAQSTADRQTQDFAYDIERTLVAGTKERVLEGLAKISPEVTR
jgi:hypothetical protein